MISLEPVTLDVFTGDEDGQLVFRHGRLVAVVSRLGDWHDDVQGHWYIEATFGEVPQPQPGTFASLPDVEQWLSRG